MPETRQVRLAVVGEYDEAFPPHVATNDWIDHAAAATGIEAEVEWVSTTRVGHAPAAALSGFDGWWISPGSPYASLPGALSAIRLGREYDVPLLGTCGGFQHVVLEYARNVLGFEDAQHAEYDPYASRLFVSELSCSLVGQTMSVTLDPDSRAAELYGATEVREEYYCDFGLNPEHQDELHSSGLRVVGWDENGEARVLELPEHRFFIATLFVPPLRSSPGDPHPLVRAFLSEGADAGRQTSMSTTGSRD